MKDGGTESKGLKVRAGLRQGYVCSFSYLTYMDRVMKEI